MKVDRYAKDLAALVEKGTQLRNAMMRECDPQEFDRIVKEKCGDKAEEVLKKLPSFMKGYQPWYSEATVAPRQGFRLHPVL